MSITQKNWMKFSFLLFFSIVGVCVFLFKRNDTSVQMYPMERTVQYSFTLKNTSSKVIENVEFYVGAPVPHSAFQKLTKISSTEDFQVINTSSKNQILLFSIDRILPLQSIPIRVRTQLVLAIDPNSSQVNPKNKYLDDEALLDIDSDLVLEAFRSLKFNSELEFLQAAYDYVREELTYKGYIKEGKGAEWALKNGTGDCTEYASLLTSLIRLKGIPARRVEGYIKDKNGTVKAQDYHSWIEVFFEGRWVILDALNEIFMGQNTDYLAFRYFPDIEASEVFSRNELLFQHGISLKMK